MASRCMIYSVNQISDLIYQTAYIVYQISYILYDILQQDILYVN